MMRRRSEDHRKLEREPFSGKCVQEKKKVENLNQINANYDGRNERTEGLSNILL